MPVPSTPFTSSKQRTTTRPWRRAKGKSLRFFRPQVELLERLVLPSTIGSTTVIWVGGSGDWDTAANWSTKQVPGANDNVQINTPGITVTHSGVDRVNSVTSVATLWLKGSTLTVTGTFQDSGGVTLLGGTLASATVDSSTTITATGQGGTLDGVTLNGTLTIANSGSNATITDGLTLDGTINLGSAAVLRINGTQSVTGSGTIVFTAAGTISPRDDLASDIRLTPGTTWTIGSGITIHGNSGTIGGTRATSPASV